MFQLVQDCDKRWKEMVAINDLKCLLDPKNDLLEY